METIMQHFQRSQNPQIPSVPPGQAEAPWTVIIQGSQSDNRPFTYIRYSNRNGLFKYMVGKWSHKNE